MHSRTRLPRLAQRLVAVTVAVSASLACSERPPTQAPLIPLPPVDGALAQIDCVAQPSAPSLTCKSADSIGAAAAGAVPPVVALTPASVAYAGGVFAFDATVQNRLGQSIGTSDGATADTAGVRLFFAETPRVTAGSGTIDFKDPSSGASLVDGYDRLAKADEPYYRYAQVLDTGATSAPKRWRLHVPPSVGGFSFRLYVVAAVRYPDGWVSISPGSAALSVGDKLSLAATVRDVIGQSITGPSLSWASSDAGVASVGTTSGVVTANAVGTATITATSGTRSGNVPITVGAPTALAFAVNSDVRWQISRFIYGVNFLTDPNVWGSVALPPITLNRMGGNRLTAYNWETNYSNSGNDLDYRNDSYLSSSTTPGEAVRARTAATFARGAAMLVTVPILGWVAGDNQGVRLDTTDANRANRLATHFKQSRAFKGAALSLTPDVSDGYVNQDEFVNWLDKTFPAARSDPLHPIMYSLDNEPDIWNSTHKEIQSDSGDDPSRPRIVTYDGFADTSIAYARAIKSVVPNAVVFGPAVATWVGVASLGRYAGGRWHDDPVYGEQNAFDVYLDRMRQAEQQYGTRLLDVLDLHWYPSTGTQSNMISNDYAAAADTAALSQIRMQAPRSLWDPAYTEPNSWVAGVIGGPIRLIRRLKDQIAAHYPGTKIAITEYYYGRGGDLSGGIAQADLLGIFGREQLFAATLWPNAGIYAQPYGGSAAKAYAYINGAFRMYLSYDGAGSRFGDTGIAATTSDSVSSSVYASLDSLGRVVIVAINKTASAHRAQITIRHPVALTAGKFYTLTATSPSPSPATSCATTVGATCVIAPGNAVAYTMPAYSVTTLVLSP